MFFFSVTQIKWLKVGLSSAINAVFYLGVEIKKSSEFGIYLGLHDG